MTINNLHRVHSWYGLLLVFASFWIHSLESCIALEDDGGLELVEHSLQFGGLTRFFVEYRPDTFPRGGGGSVVIVLHGGYYNMRSVFAPASVGSRRWIDLSDTNGFLVLAPNGVNALTGATNGPGIFQWSEFPEFIDGNDRDDAGFIVSVANWAIFTRGVDPSKVYLTGASYGGGMVFTCLLEYPDFFASAANFINQLPAVDVGVPAIPTPIFLLSGTADLLVPFEGGLTIRGEQRSSRETRDYWIAANNANPVLNDVGRIPDMNPDDQCTMRFEYYDAFEGGAPVMYVVMEGGGHVYPAEGQDVILTFRPGEGPPCGDAWGVDLAWDFMKQF